MTKQPEPGSYEHFRMIQCQQVGVEYLDPEERAKEKHERHAKQARLKELEKLSKVASTLPEVFTDEDQLLDTLDALLGDNGHVSDVQGAGPGFLVLTIARPHIGEEPLTVRVWEVAKVMRQANEVISDHNQTIDNMVSRLQDALT